MALIGGTIGSVSFVFIRKLGMLKGNYIYPVFYFGLFCIVVTPLLQLFELDQKTRLSNGMKITASYTPVDIIYILVIATFFTLGQ